MTNKKEPTTEELAQAVAKDYYLSIQNDLSKMSPGQLQIAKKALADFETKTSDSSKDDFDRKVNSMTDQEFSRFKQDLNWAAAKQGKI